MTRVAVIGNAGGGKSTMCRKLGQALDIAVYPLDKIQWKPGWVRTAAEEFKQKHEEWLGRERWIIGGWGPWEAIEARFEAADTIIFVDHPLSTHYWWAFKRQFKCLFRPRPGGPEGCPMLPMTWQLIKMIWKQLTDGMQGLCSGGLSPLAKTAPTTFSPVWSFLRQGLLPNRYPFLAVYHKQFGRSANSRVREKNCSLLVFS